MKTIKLLQIQTALKAPKNQRNNFWNYNYRSCEDILEAVKPLLDSVWATLSISDDIIAVWERVYVKATCTLKDTETWEIIEQTSAFARESETKKWMDDSQITGSASSYARKYALNGLFCIDDTKDADATNDHWKLEWPFSDTPKKVAKAIKKETEQDIASWEWYEKALKEQKFMLACLDEEDFIRKIKSKYQPTEQQEKNLRIAYQNAKQIEALDKEDPFNA